MDAEKKDNQLTDEKALLFKALLEKPTTYHVLVINRNSLPEKLKKKEEISFEIKPPVLSTLAKIGEIMNKLPDDVQNPKANQIKLLEHSRTMCEVIAILAHGNSNKEMPSWYVDFLADNLTPEEALNILQESTFKLRTDFFLPFFHTAKLTNPMQMMKPPKKKESVKN